MKGKQLLYNTLVQPSLGQAQGEKGQRNAFLDRRHDAMACRYYYYANICRMRYDDCLMCLSNEFFLTPNAIVLNLKKRLAFINRLAQNETTTAELRRRYPYFDWSARVMAGAPQL